MKVTCPHCQRELAPQDVNMAQNLGYCQNCRDLFPLSGLANFQDDGEADADSQLVAREPPGGTKVLYRGNTVVVLTPQSRKIVFFLIPFTAVWSGFSLWGIYGTQFLKGKFDLTQSLFGLPFLLGTCFLLFLIVYVLFSKIMLRIDDYGVTFHNGCFKAPVHEYDIPDDSSFDNHDNASQKPRWRGPRHWNWDQLKNVVLEQNQHRRTMIAPSHSTDCTLTIPPLPAERQQFLAAMLRHEARRRRIHLNVLSFP